MEAWLIADFVKTAIARPTIESVAGRPVLVFRSTPEASWSLMGKRAIDLTGAILGLICVSWLLVLVAAIIRLTSPGPVFFRQLRGGRHGKPFMMFKFRSDEHGRRDAPGGVPGVQPDEWALCSRSIVTHV